MSGQTHIDMHEGMWNVEFTNQEKGHKNKIHNPVHKIK